MKLVYVMDYAARDGYLVRVPKFIARPLVKWLIRHQYQGHGCWDWAAHESGVCYRVDCHACTS